jgi:hypothetical protein
MKRNTKGGIFMDDKAIRKILISYLEATNTTIRIYEEKTIGS